MSSDPLIDPQLRRTRASRPELFMNIAELYAQRSSCLRARIGAVAVRGGRIIATGYVGAPAGMPHCLDVGCEIGPDGGCIRSIHAEANLVAWSARTGTPLKNTQVYCTMACCYACAKLLLQAGIDEFIYVLDYRDRRGIDLLRGQHVLVHA